MRHAIRVALAIAVVVVVVVVVGCSRNEAASLKCNASPDSASCQSCCNANGGSGYTYTGASSCGCLGGKASASVTSAPSAGGAVSFAGTYTSTWGPTTFSQVGARVTARYPKGSMTCTAVGNALDCDWRESAMFGKARLVKELNGSIDGTWSNGGSATNGGPWLFKL